MYGNIAEIFCFRQVNLIFVPQIAGLPGRSHGLVKIKIRGILLMIYSVQLPIAQVELR